MAALTLAYYDVKRLFRHKYVLLPLCLLPVVCGLIRLLFARFSIAPPLVWLCPLLCAVAVCGVLHIQRMVDRAAGLFAGFKSIHLSGSTLVVSRLIAGAAIFVAQMVVFWVLGRAF